MEDTLFTIRQIREDDDFDRITHLLNDTMIRNMLKDDINYGKGDYSPAYTKDLFFPQDYLENELVVSILGAHYGLVVEEENSIVAVMGVGISQRYQNGYLMVGYEEASEKHIPTLLEYIERYLKKNNIVRLQNYTLILPGRIRNHQISFWEKYGFVSDLFFHAIMRLEIKDWQEPEHINTDDIEVQNEINRDEIISLLLEDGEVEMADLFHQEYDYVEKVEKRNYGKNAVCIKLLDKDTDEVIGFSYYRVFPFSFKKAEKPKITGQGLTFHFRPTNPLSRKVKKRLIQATLLSMKELGIEYVVASKTSKDFDSFIEMIAEGFDVAPENGVRLVKQVN